MNRFCSTLSGGVTYGLTSMIDTSASNRCTSRAELRVQGLGSLGVDAVAGDGFGDDLVLDLTVLCERGEDGDHDVAVVDLEVVAEVLAGVAAAEAVGAERGPRAGHPAGDLVGHRLHEIGDGHERTLGPAQLAG